MWPVEIAAIATGETAYRKAAGIEIQEFFVKRLSSLEAVNIMMTGATKKKVVIRNCTLPRKTRDAVAVITTHVGVATDEPIPTWCHDSKYVRQRSVAPAGEIGSAPPTNAPNLLRELRIEIIAIRRKPITSGRLKIPNQ